MTRGLLVFLAGSISISFFVEAEPPPNDDFEDAIDLPSEAFFDVEMRLHEATFQARQGEEDEPLCGHTAWYRYTPPASGVLQFTRGTLGKAPISDRLRLEIYRGDRLRDLAKIEATNSSLFVLKKERIPVQEGVPIMIRVAYGGCLSTPDYGHYYLQGELEERPFRSLSFVEPSGHWNDFFEDRWKLGDATEVAILGTSAFATRELFEPESSGARTVWYEWEAKHSGKVVAYFDYADHFAYGLHEINSMAVYRGKALQELALVVEDKRFTGFGLLGALAKALQVEPMREVVFDAVAGETYQFAVGQTSTGGGWHGGPHLLMLFAEGDQTTAEGAMGTLTVEREGAGRLRLEWDLGDLLPTNPELWLLESSDLRSWDPVIPVREAVGSHLEPGKGDGNQADDRQRFYVIGLER